MNARMKQEVYELLRELAQTAKDERGEIEQLLIGRIEDLPYWTSPPVQYVYSSTAPVIGGAYTWIDPPSALTPPREVLANTAYFIRSVTTAADVSVIDYTQNIITVPQFSMFLEGNALQPLFREPISSPNYLVNFDFRQLWFPAREDDVLRAAWRGTINQGSGLVGKATITLTAIVSVQEIVDDQFINLLRSAYPNTGDTRRASRMPE